jgi:hypothetical protein
MVLKWELLVLCFVSASCGSNRFGEDVVAGDAGVDQVVAQLDAQDVDVAVADAASSDAMVEAEAAPRDAACNVDIETPPLEPAVHVPEGTPITYSTNPPSSGPHYPIWANFVEYDKPIPDGYLVHSMEHGAVLLLYDCDPTACTPPPGVVEALRAVRDAVATDPLCDPSLRVRVIIAPRPANDVPIAAAAWGAIYRADCVDAPSLSQFIADHYAKAPENFCSPGVTF